MAFDKQRGRAHHSVRAVLLQPSGPHGATRLTRAMVGERYNPSRLHTLKLSVVTAAFLCFAVHAFAFEGRITVEINRGGSSENLLYTVGTNCLRIERLESDQPYPRNLMNRQSGEMDLLFPHNRSFLRLKNTGQGVASPATPRLKMPGPFGMGPRPAPGNVAAVPTAAGSPAGASIMPVRPMMPGESVDLKATGQTTNLLGYDCAGYELKQRGEVMEIWATDKLFPFQPYLQNQPHPLGPRVVEEQWPGLLQSRKLFPLLAVLKLENGGERLRFEVKSVKPERLDDSENTLFQTPADYRGIQPLPF